MIHEFLKSGTLLSLGNNKLLIGFGKRTWITDPDEQQVCFYFPDFFLSNSTPWFTQENCFEITYDQLFDELKQLKQQDAQWMPWSNPYQPLFVDTFHQLQTLFSSQALLKAVPYIFETSATKVTPNHLVKSLLSILQYADSRAVSIYGFWGEHSGILGATPEILFSLSDRLLRTSACAGTSIGDKNRQQLLEKTKELREHQLVIDGITSSLQPFGQLSIQTTELLNLPGLAHLLTPITLQLTQSVAIDKLIKAIHPTPALGAFPKEEGWKWLLEYQEKVDRNRFGAPVGYISTKQKREALFYVAIRNVQWQDSTARIGAGCGVIKESVCEEEWKEIEAKIEAIKNMVSL